MGPRPFVLTGAPGLDLERSARVLTELGAPCGHEDVFHLAAFERGGTLFWPPGLAGDASWLAAPVLERLPAGCVVVHQVGDREATTDWLKRSGFFAREQPTRAFAEDFLDAPFEGDPERDGERLWTAWNRMIAAAQHVAGLRYWRLRDGEVDEYAWSETLALLGVVRNPASVRLALSAG